MGYIDIIIYAVVAALLLARLWAVFGRRNEEDRERSNPFASPPQEEESSVMLPGRVRANNADANSASRSFAPLRVAPNSLLGGLEKIKELDPSFDEKRFLQTVKQNFSLIVEDFTKGDLARSANLLSPVITDHFKKAIEARKNAGETLQNRITRIKDADVTSAKIDGTRAILTVKIDSEQENILRDAQGNIVSGGIGKREEISDIWVFSHDTKAADPLWQVIETRTA